MAERLEKELQVEQAAKSPLGRLEGALGQRDSLEAKIASGAHDRSNAAPPDQGFGAGLLEEHRRSRAWMLALAGIIAATIIRMIFRAL